MSTKRVRIEEWQSMRPADQLSVLDTIQAAGENCDTDLCQLMGVARRALLALCKSPRRKKP